MSTGSTLLADSLGVLEYNAAALWTVLLLAAVALVVAVLVPRRRVVVAGAGLSLALAVGLTIPPFGGWGALHFETGALRSIVTNLEPHRSALTGWFRNSDGPANVALFAPAGLFVGLLSRRPVLTATGLTATSFAIECWQATLTTRVGSFDDVVANGLGAALGAALAAVLLGVTALGRRARRTTDPSRPLTRVG